MTSFEHTMPDYPMVEQGDDLMEDSIFFGRQDQTGDDIDVDLEFNNDAQQDEQMAENDLEYTNDDVEAGLIVSDKDDEMADDGGRDELEDQEIQDAPLVAGNATIQSASTEVRMVEQPTPEPFNIGSSAVHDELIDFEDEDEDEVQADGIPAAQKVEENSALPSMQKQGDDKENDDVDEDLFVRAQDSSRALKSSTSFEGLEENNAPSVSGKNEVPLATSEDQAVNTEGSETLHTAIENPNTQGSQDHDSEATVVSDGITNGENEESNNVKTTLPEEDPLTHNATKLYSVDVESPLQHGKPVEVDQADVQKPDLTSAEGLVTKNPKDPTAAPVRSHKQETSYSSWSVDDTLIVVDYNGSEMSLFMSDSSELFLLSDYGLIEQDLCALLGACKPVLSADLDVNEELVLSVPVLGLEFAESAEEATTTSLAQLRDTYTHLSHNDGVERPEPLRVAFKFRYKVSARLETLRTMIEQGKGLRELTDEAEAFDDNESSENAVQIPKITRGKDHPDHDNPYPENGETFDPKNQEQENAHFRDHHERVATPLLENEKDDADDFLDFRSPLHKAQADPEGTVDGKLNEVPEGRTDKVSPDQDGTAHDDFELGGEYIENEEELFKGDTEFDKLFPPETSGTDGHEELDFVTDTNLDFVANNVIDYAVSDSNRVVDKKPSDPSAVLQSRESNSLSDKTQPLENKTDNDSTREQPIDFDELEPAEDDNLGFDFDDYAQEGNVATEIEPGKTTDADGILAPKASGGTVHPTSTNAGDAPNIVNEELETGFDADEIDFPDDEEVQYNDNADVSDVALDNSNLFREKTDSLKRTRPQEEDAIAPDISPNPLKRQRSN